MASRWCHVVLHYPYTWIWFPLYVAAIVGLGWGVGLLPAERACISLQDVSAAAQAWQWIGDGVQQTLVVTYAYDDARPFNRTGPTCWIDSALCRAAALSATANVTPACVEWQNGADLGVRPATCSNLQAQSSNTNAYFCNVVPALNIMVGFATTIVLLGGAAIVQMCIQWVIYRLARQSEPFVLELEPRESSPGPGPNPALDPALDEPKPEPKEEEGEGAVAVDLVAGPRI